MEPTLFAAYDMILMKIGLVIMIHFLACFRAHLVFCIKCNPIDTSNYQLSALILYISSLFLISSCWVFVHVDFCIVAGRACREQYLWPDKPESVFLHIVISHVGSEYRVQ